MSPKGTFINPLTTLPKGLQYKMIDKESVIAAQKLISPNLESRKEGFLKLMELGTHKTVPLLAYLLASRILEKNLELRAQIIKAIAEMVDLDHRKNIESTIIQLLHDSFAEMRTREIYALLEVADLDAEFEYAVSVLLKLCSFAGAHLAEILSNREHPVPIRMQAASFIAMLGYLDGLLTLERMASRLESKYPQQFTLPGLRWDIDKNHEASLYPVIQKALKVLKSS